MKLITEQIMDVEYIVESVEGKKSHFISGVFMQAEKANRNGRIYPKGVLESELNKYQSSINEKRALGELGHPESPSLNLDKVSHLITALKFEGNDIVGKAKILDTPMGNIARNFLDEGVKLGVSSRGMGSVLQRGSVNEVQKDFRLATVDIVHEPSGIDCWVNGIMEGAEWIFNASSNSWVLAEQIQQELRNKNMKAITESQLGYFKHFLNNIK
jgi:hypothetical protein